MRRANITLSIVSLVLTARSDGLRHAVSLPTDGEGCPLRVIGVSIDVSERKRAEEQQRALLAELDHRVKNALATVSAIAHHTKAASTSMDAFVTALDTRIYAMASTHELLSSCQWEGVPLRQLLFRDLAPYASSNNTCI